MGRSQKCSSRVFSQVRYGSECVLLCLGDMNEWVYIGRSETLYLAFWGSLRDMRLNYPPIEPNAVEVGEEEVEQPSSTIARQVELSSSTTVR